LLLEALDEQRQVRLKPDRCQSVILDDVLVGYPEELRFDPLRVREKDTVDRTINRTAVKIPVRSLPAGRMVN
jgi:hypothetical protein